MEFSSSAESTVLRTCFCGLEVVVRTSWTNANPGRQFRGCPGEGGTYCNVFQWVDPPMCRRAKEIIPGLLNKLGEKDRQLNELRQKVFINQSLQRRVLLYRYVAVALLVTVILVMVCNKAKMFCL
ncbi:UNVERIFIED_CONTAM: hypothetical protein Sradi_3836900 [Sesamum radiatum]|uniref:GRF-type domain-containing protein n=1 Tax=Sesamum radiatum TaxID=300843 RepID=A0AAW2Q0Y0_SESRA